MCCRVKQTNKRFTFNCTSFIYPLSTTHFYNIYVMSVQSRRRGAGIARCGPTQSHDISSFPIQLCMSQYHNNTNPVF